MRWYKMIINQSVKIILLICVLSLAGCASKPSFEDEPKELTPVPQLLKQGKRQLRIKQYVTAIFFYEQALEQEPKNLQALLGIADAHMGKNDLANSRKRYEEVLSYFPDNLHALEGKALVYFKRHDYQRAKRQLNQVLKKDNRRWRSWSALGVIADLEGTHKTAQKHFRKALSIYKTNAMTLNNLGYSLLMSKKYKAAEKIFRQGLSYEPGFFRIRNNLAISLAWQKRYEEAISILVKVVKHEIAYNNIGYIAMLNKQYAVAKSYFKKAIALSPNYYVRAVLNLQKLEDLMRLKK